MVEISRNHEFLTNHKRMQLNYFKDRLTALAGRGYLAVTAAKQEPGSPEPTRGLYAGSALPAGLGEVPL